MCLFIFVGLVLSSLGKRRAGLEKRIKAGFFQEATTSKQTLFKDNLSSGSVDCIVIKLINILKKVSTIKT